MDVLGEEGEENSHCIIDGWELQQQGRHCLRNVESKNSMRKKRRVELMSSVGVLHVVTVEIDVLLFVVEGLMQLEKMVRLVGGGLSICKTAITC